MGTLIQKHQDRAVDSPGDNLLAEFASVVDAVQCAVEIQQVLKAKKLNYLKTDTHAPLYETQCMH
jgi:class 3 adenylate cyclase